MIKTLQQARRGERDKFTVPKSAQKTIPVKCIYGDGIFQVARKFSKTWAFQDINYAAASQDAQMDMFLGWCGLLNCLPTDATVKITINNRTFTKREFDDILLHMRDDGLDRYRHELNDIIREKAGESNNLVQERYITISTEQRDIERARSYFQRVENDLVSYMGKLGAKTAALSLTERLRVLHDFFHAGDEQDFLFDLQAVARHGHDFKDSICPDDIQFHRDYFEMGGRYGRVLFLKEYASYIKDSMVAELTDFSRNLILSINVLPIPTDEAVKEMQNKVMGVETDVTRWQQRQNMQNNFSAALPLEMKMQRTESNEFLNDLTSRDQRMMFTVVTLVHTADTLEALDEDTETLKAIGRKNLCTFSALSYQQEDGLNTTLPYGLRRVHALRTMTTESVAVLMPFSTQEVLDRGGIFHGQNAISKNLIVLNKKNLLNGNQFVLGVSGSGKSFAVKLQIVYQALTTNDHILVIDPEGEYAPLIRALGGEVIRLASNSGVDGVRINAMDLSKNLQEKDPVAIKSELIMGIYDAIEARDNTGPRHKSIIDRCVSNIFKPDYTPVYGVHTMLDLYNNLLEQEEPEAHDIALALELFTKGNLRLFAEPSNVTLNNRITCFDIRDLGKQIMDVANLVMLDYAQNLVADVKQAGGYTHVFIDEFSQFFRHEYSGDFFKAFWQRIRKSWGYATGISQNIEECINSDTARYMLANSEFLTLLNQSATDRVELAKLLNISDTQLSYIANAEEGRGLLKVGPAIVPFINEFPKDTALYRLITTRPGEGV